jgi:hypothetical protein
MSTPLESVLSADEISANKEAADQAFNEAVEERYMKAAEDAGLLNEDGEVDQDLLADRVYEELKPKHVVHIGPDQDDRTDPATSSTKDELTSAVFFAGPTLAEAENGNKVLQKAYERCQAAVWNLTAQGRRGHAQKRLEADKLLVIRGKVFRNGNPVSTGIYVSTQEEIVRREYLGPRLEKLRKLTEAIEEDRSLASELDPALDASMQAAIDTAMNEAAVRLQVNALGAGTAPSKAIEK